MLKFDDLKAFDVAALGRESRPKAAATNELPVSHIDPDPGNIRRQCDKALIAALAETIKTDGLLQAIVVRHNPVKPGRYLVSYGERRLRAVLLLGQSTIAAIINNDFDPYRQAIENLQREDLHPLDVAEWIARREAEGDSRTEIARRLGKPKSYVSEVAQLAAAPDDIKMAFRARRIPDLRTAYLLTKKIASHPEEVRQLLSSDASITRMQARALTSETALKSKGNRADERHPVAPEPRPANSPSIALAVNIDGRVGLMRLKPAKSQKHGVVYFEDGSERTVALELMRLQNWAVL